MTDVFADSFYYFALLDRTDSYHSRVESFVTTHRGGLVTTDWVLAEVGDGLAYSRASPGSSLPLINRRSSAFSQRT